VFTPSVLEVFNTFPSKVSRSTASGTFLIYHMQQYLWNMYHFTFPTVVAKSCENQPMTSCQRIYKHQVRTLHLFINTCSVGKAFQKLKTLHTAQCSLYTIIHGCKAEYLYGTMYIVTRRAITSHTTENKRVSNEAKIWLYYSQGPGT